MDTNKIIIDLSESENFEEVLDKLAKPLIAKNYIKSEYTLTILENLAKNGPYFILAPEICLPHSNRSDLVNQTCLSFGKSAKPIKIGNAEAKVFILLAAKNPDMHLDYLTKLVTIMDTNEKQNKLVQSTFEEFSQLIHNI